MYGLLSDNQCLRIVILPRYNLVQIVDMTNNKDGDIINKYINVSDMRKVLYSDTILS